MKYWKEATPEEYEKATSRATTQDGRLFVVVKSGDLAMVIKDLLEEL